jgi:hypothetical protein
MKDPFDYPMAKYVHDVCLEEGEATNEYADGPWETLMSKVMYFYWGKIKEEGGF